MVANQFLQRQGHLSLARSSRRGYVWEDEGGNERPMSRLRQALKRPRNWLIFWGAVLLLAAADSFRAPSNQVTAKLWVRFVRLYQSVGRPLIRDHVQCRYHPTCSEYSVEAVETHGIRRGLVLTVTRIASCTPAVEPGTHDPVPPAAD
jgi:putative membrane protein insertion efficiency factor